MSVLDTILERGDALEAENARLKEFLRWAMREGPWRGNDLDGGSVQTKAEALGLIVKVPYHPDKHGPTDEDVEPGDDWYALAPGIAE